MQPGRAAQLFLLLMTLPLLWQCIKTPLEPVAPKYYTQLAIPLTDRTYYFADVVNKDPKFDTTTIPTQILYNPTKEQLGERLGLPASVFVMDTSELRGNTINSELGVVPVTVPNIPPVSMNAAGLSIPSGSTIVLPPYSVAIDQSLNSAPDGSFKYVVFENGTMSLTFQNTLPVAISLQNNQVALINDTVTNTPVATFTFSGKIPANGGQLTSSPVPLAGITMYNKLRARTTITTDSYNYDSTKNPPISNPLATPITVGASSGVTLTPIIANTTIQSAFARLSTDFSNFPVATIPDSAVKLSDSILVKTADFRSGNMRIQLQNEAPLAVVVRFRIDEFIDKRTNSYYKLGDDIGQPGDSLITIDAKSNIDVTLPMSRFRFVSRSRDLLTGDTLPTRFLHFSLQIKTLVKNTSYQTIKKTDYVFASVQPTSQFVLESVYGQIPPQQLAVNETYDVGIGDINSRLTLDGLKSGVTMKIGILSTGLFPTYTDLRIYPIDANSHTGSPVHILTTILPHEPQEIALASTAVDSLLNAFLPGALPSKMQVVGSATVSPKQLYGTTAGDGSVKQGDSVYVTLNYAIPVQIGIKNGFLWDTASIAQNNIDTARIHLITQGTINFTVTNAFPMALNLVMKLMKGQDTLLTIPQPSAAAIKIDADTSTSSHPSGLKNYTYVTLTPTDAAKLNLADKVYVGLSMKTGNDNGATPKTFYKSDFVHVKTYANITFDVDFDRLK
jgi:hypothetical protein